MIYIKYFAKYREWVGVASEELQEVPLNLAGLMMLIRERHANALKILDDPRCIVAINQQVVRGDAVAVLVKSGDEVAFYPPVTGG